MKNEIADVILGEHLGSSSPVNAFSDQSTKLLNKLPPSNILRIQIIESRKRFLEEMLGFSGAVQEDGAIKRKYQKYIPSNDVINLIERAKAFGYQEVEDEYYERYLNFSNPQTAQREQARSMMKNGEVVLIPDIEDFFSEPKGTLVYCIQGEVGVNDYLLLHEIFHRICLNDRSISGIDCIIPIMGFQNKYDPTKRKYEILNETIADIFAIKALKLLREQGISLVESVEYQNEERIMSMNTPKELKELVMPFVNQYQDLLIATLLTGKNARGKLIEQIGARNFEAMNDIINHLYSLMKKGITKQIENGEKNQETKQYKELVKELETVYTQMERNRIQCVYDKSLYDN